MYLFELVFSFSLNNHPEVEFLEEVAVLVVIF